jgi:hypothetical protein
MLTRFRERFGTAGVIVAVIALVAALGGTALAASGALTGKQKKEVEKIAKKFQGTGPAGAAGPAGSNGRDGSNGKDGPTGAAGSNGTAGTAGAPGAAGKSVTAATEPAGASCEFGGSRFQVEGSATKTYACNGKEGEEGEKGDEGSPWTAGGSLPPEATETGAWGFAGEGALTGFGTLNFGLASFTLPLPAPLEESQMHLIPQGGPSTTECPGTSVEPAAAPGAFCAYVSEVEMATYATSISAGISGVKLLFLTEGEGENKALGSGTWAVTAPAEP